MDTERLMRQRHAETAQIRAALEAKLGIYGYPEKDFASLVFDVSEFHEACRIYLDHIRTLLDAKARDLFLGVELATIGAYLEDARGHLEDAIHSLARFHSFLSEQDETRSPSKDKD